jgi:L-asparaginase
MPGPILIITTGGTIDAEPYGATIPEMITPRGSSLVPQAVESLGLKEVCAFYHYFAKDSKDFKTEDLEFLAQLIREQQYGQVIITHGTDAMPENSRALAALLGDTEKKIIFTGAMLPLSQPDRRSDGFDNLAFAARNIENFPSGVSVVMHGRRFGIATLYKDFTRMEMREGTPPSR